MRLIADPTQRFPQRPFFESGELDADCEQLIGKFLRELHGKVEYPVLTDDLTKLLERHTEDLDLYADLELEYGLGVEGVTLFRRGMRPSVRVHSALSENTSRENRLRTTLTHEFGHVRYHAWLFDEQQNELFPRNPLTPPVQACKRETIVDAPIVDWMEWQAGHVSGAILMPASRVRRLARAKAEASPPPSLEAVTAQTDFGQSLLDSIVDAFQVSREAAGVRLVRLGIFSSNR